MQTTLGTPTVPAVLFFLLIVALTLAITYWAARRTRSTSEFYAAGRSISPLQNGLALAGDYMSAASFLGIAGLVALRGYDGMIYATGWLVGWPALMFLIAEPVRNLGKYTFADVGADRQGAAAALRRDAPGGSDSRAVPFLAGRVVLRGGGARRPGSARAGRTGLGSDRRGLAGARADVRPARPSPHPDALLYRARRPRRPCVGALCDGI